MGVKKLPSIRSREGFILPLTMILLLFLSLLCFQGLYQLDVNQSELTEQQTTTQLFFIFQSACTDLRPVIESTLDRQGSGVLIESETQVTYNFKFISTTQIQINLSSKSALGSTLSVTYVYNKETKQIEQWVNQ
ncbi:MAG TPA: competence type IV pilus minor pilin ComGG [Candidatus Angelobacter sp.]|nr:competence type IV pilus minor pilin ComGG [Candidatus Angelobacter sp.]